jgi:hypothetical protein
VQEELAIERDRRQAAGQERDKALEGRQEAEDRLLEMLAAQDAENASQAGPGSLGDPQTTRRPRKTMAAADSPAGGDRVEQPRRRERPAKSGQSEAEIVEWWKPGWRNRIR